MDVASIDWRDVAKALQSGQRVLVEGEANAAVEDRPNGCIECLGDERAGCNGSPAIGAAKVDWQVLRYTRKNLRQSQYRGSRLRSILSDRLHA